MSFFAAPQAAAVLKHGILRRYLPIFATKTGSRAGEVVYLDGYAGPGLYDDGTEGSPFARPQHRRGCRGFIAGRRRCTGT